MVNNLKIAFAQINLISGNVEYNKNKIIEYIKNAKKEGAKLVVFPELALLGYPMGDILERYPVVVSQMERALEEIKEECDKIAAVVGFVRKNKDKFGKPFFNSVALLKDKEIDRIIDKSLLPNYSEHNDYRYFEPAEIQRENRIFELFGVKFGLIICEDGWNDFSFFKRNLYKIDPVAEVAPLVDVLICPAASCTRAKKEQLKHNMMSACAKKYKIKYAYINQVGANDELVYDGLSRLYNEQGEIIAMAKAFEEDLAIVDIEKGGVINPLPKGLERTLNSQKEFSLDHEPDLERTYLTITTAIRDYFSKNGFKRAVLGLSGGLDSSVCAVLLADALGPKNVLGVSMPSKLTSSDSKNDALELAKNLGINFIETPIKDCHTLFSSKFEGIFEEAQKGFKDCRYKNSFTQDNIQARSRAMILWGIANEFGATLPIATSDKSELYMGYATINGDMSGGFAPIADVSKTKLFALARWLRENREIKNAIPESIILKPPGAELAIDPKTGKTLLAEDALMPYEFLDEVIWRIENYNQTIENMLEEEFLYEKKNEISSELKKQWLEKFFRRLNTALYKWYIVPPSPIVDGRTINKIEFKQPIISNINYYN